MSNDFGTVIKEALDDIACRRAAGWVFRPHAWFNEAGDQIECYLEDASSYSEWLNPYIDVQRAQDDDRIVGITIGGVKQMLEGVVVPPRQDVGPIALWDGGSGI